MPVGLRALRRIWAGMVLACRLWTIGHRLISLTTGWTNVLTDRPA